MPFARAFADDGFVVLVHDHRTFGASDGEPRQDVDPWQQIADWRWAISYLESRPEADADRIGLWGSNYAGGHTIVLGATDRRLRAVVSQVPTISGYEQGLRRVAPDAVASLDFYLQATPDGAWEAAKAGGPGDASLGMFLYKLAHVPVITIAKVRGRARGGGNELALACDMIFAARENAVFGQFESGTGALPGAGGIQHLTRRLGRTRAIEAITLDGFVERLAKRIAGFPPAGVKAAKRAINDLTLPPPANVRSDSATFLSLVALPESRERLDYLTNLGLQTPGDLERDLGKAVAEFPG
ncbi:enoyl-CoA hydratase-related protein [Streptomyces collinus]